MFHFLADAVAQFLNKLNSSFVSPSDCYFDKFEENRLREVKSRHQNVDDFHVPIGSSRGTTIQIVV